MSRWGNLSPEECLNYLNAKSNWVQGHSTKEMLRKREGAHHAEVFLEPMGVNRVRTLRKNPTFCIGSPREENNRGTFREGACTYLLELAVVRNMAPLDLG